MLTWSKDKITLLKAYLEGGLLPKDIAVKLKMTPDSVSGAIRRYNLNKYRKEEELPVLDLKELDDRGFDELKQAAKLQWKVPTTDISKNPKNKFKTYVIVGDIHVPEHDSVAVNSVLKLMDDVKFDGIINIGDYMNLSCISHWNENKHKTLEGKRLKNDYVHGNALLDEFDKRLPEKAEKYFLTGNHEDWLNQLIERFPALDGLFDIDSGLHLTERGYKITPYNEIVRFGRLCITHGIYCGANPAKTHATKLLSNILVGHTHSPEMCLIHSPAKELSIVSYVNGCLCHMSPDYMKSKPSNWATGFAVLYLFPNGYFDVNLVRIVKGRYVFNGKLYDGNKK